RGEAGARVGGGVGGDGSAGVAAGSLLAGRSGIAGVVLAVVGPPLSLTSDKSTEAYRNWWPGPDDAMLRLMNRSIDLLEALAGESDNVFRLNRRGDVYATADRAHAPGLPQDAGAPAAPGAGPPPR